MAGLGQFVGFDMPFLEGYHQVMATTVRKLTTADYEKIPADGFRHEIIDGEEFITPAPNLDHQRVVVKVTTLLENHVAGKKLGRVFVSPTDVVLSRHDIVEPDVVFVSEQRFGILTEKNIQGAPDLVIEVFSPSTQAEDRGKKLTLYQGSGIVEYWIVDPSSKTVEIREFGTTRRTRVYKEGQSFESAVLAGLTVHLSDVFST
jgi:Uma2 family endonuclease